MNIQCNSCEKTFVVSDGAITKDGRLVQCSSCGNKWKQFPIIENIQKENPIKELQLKEKSVPKLEIKKKKKKTKKAKKLLNPYTEEYLKKKTWARYY